MKKKKLGEVLRERGQISPTNLERAVADQQTEMRLLGEVLLKREMVSKDRLVSALEEITNIPYMDCSAISPEPAALRKINQDLARKCVALPVAQQGSKLVVVMAEPQNLVRLGEIKFAAGINISPRFGFREEILQAIDKYYSASDTLASSLPFTGPEMHQDVDGTSDMEFISTSSRQANRDALRETQIELLHKSTPAVRVVSEVIRAANEKRASDIHIEPQDNEVVVRIRVDGVLRDLRQVPRTMQNNLISRIKILADMDIGERRMPQDGRFKVRLGSTGIEVRVSTLPTQYGEKVVMRLLNASSGVVSFPELRSPAHVENPLRQVLDMPQGMLLVTGPTGSGKSTTLYAALNLIHRTAVNIVTVEDPVEYVLPGINQVHVNVKTGLTFASCLRSILRQDPNVIMIGEIRDKETAEIALKAAQTGHLVLSTLHTNDSLSAVTRMLDLGIPPFMVASSVTAVMSQRLVRRLCECRREVPATAEALERLADLGMKHPVDRLVVPVGCDACDQTGYRGRIGIYEIMMFDEGIRDAIRTGESSDTICSIMRSMGMKPMMEDALNKIQNGITSLDEVARVVPAQVVDSSECSACGRRIARTFQFCPHCGARQDEPGSFVGGRSSSPSRPETVKR